MAIERGNYEIVEFLIRNNVNLNLSDNLGWLPLHTSILKNQGAIAELLIKKGAKIDLFDLNGISPICYAAEMGNHEIVELLIHNGADVDALDQNKYNALHYAIMELGKPCNDCSNTFIIPRFIDCEKWSRRKSD